MSFFFFLALFFLSCEKNGPANGWQMTKLNPDKQGGCFSKLHYTSEHTNGLLTFTITKTEDEIRGYVASPLFSMYSDQTKHQTHLIVTTSKQQQHFIIDLFEQGYKARLSGKALAFITNALSDGEDIDITCGSLDLHLEKEGFASSLKQFQSPPTSFFQKQLITFDLYSQNR